MPRNCLALILIVLLLAGCQAAAPSTPAPASSTAAVSPTAAATFTPTPTSVPTPTPTPTLAPCTETAGRVEWMQMDSELLDRPLDLQIYFPPCYGWPGEEDARYPVLYFLHGQLGSEKQWQELGAPEAADELIAAGRIRPYLIVMPDEDDNLTDPTTSRFPDMIIQELIPWVDSQYSTCTDRECRAIGGLSRGGGWAMNLAFQHWEMFGSVGGHSLPPFYGYTTRMPIWLADMGMENIPRIYIDIGTGDPYLAAASEFEDLLTHLRVPHEWHLNTGIHNEAYWSAQVKNYLRWYFPAQE